MLRRVIRKAGGEPGSDGEPVGEAERDGDAIRAADLVLQVAGEKEQPHEHLHKHLHIAFGDMTVEELEVLGTTGKWPERYRALAEKVATRGTDGLTGLPRSRAAVGPPLPSARANRRR